MSTDWKARMHRIFRPDGRCFQIAMDHGLFNEYSLVQGLEDITAVIDLALRAQPDALLLSPGQARRLQERRLEHKPALIMRADVTNLYDPRRPDFGYSELLDADLEQALRLDAAGILLNLLWCAEQPRVHQHSIRNIAKMRTVCDRFGMPLMVEPLVLRADGPGAGYQVVSDFELVAALHRQAAELGVDVIKADPTDDLDRYTELVELTKPIPLLPRGGGKVKVEQILERTWRMLEAGAAGVVYGRNIFQHRHMEGMAAAIRGLVHEGLDVAAALRRVETA
ncbi:MAG: class I fructose-bisphosphate aldolase [Acidobacteriota bacterium]